MSRPVTLFTGQWADMPIAELAPKAASWGYDGLELATWGDHLDVHRVLDEDGYAASHKQLLEDNGLDLYAISCHLVGQAVADKMIDGRHKAIVPAHVWGDGEPEGVRQRAAAEVVKTAEAAAELGLEVVTGFTGSPIWHLFYSWPPNLPEDIEAGFQETAERWTPILDRFQELGVRFALEVHPSEIAFDGPSWARALDAMGGHPAFGVNFDPSHFGYQNADYVRFIRDHGDRIYHVHMKDVWWSDVRTEAGTLGGHTEFGDARRSWDFRSLGRGRIDFEEIIRALNDIGYDGPLSVEWEDMKMDREHGAAEAAAFVRSVDFPASDIVFDQQFSKASERE
ncbi:sugar phosphate isomerase/epimerase family protein [Rubrivirga sp.]|uniref:sugar phosphate isomerase/epimerase family protein n=1 Tax=Rubrivirga sp. TaxID=1885344 RepID=UPI003B52BA68